jgi:phospholipid/cholesterol/gamma-HCH transport system permease protein
LKREVLLDAVAGFGSATGLAGRSVRAFFAAPIEWRPVIAQMDTAGIGSWSVAVLALTSTGMSLALQFAHGLEPYGASLYTGKLASLGVVRELAPLLTALLVGGRVGSGYAAELGSMVVNEQIDAMRALGADPIKKLVAPRVVACTLMMPLLVMLADVVGVLGAGVVTTGEVGITWKFFFNQLMDTLWASDLLHGLLKSVVFGFIIGVTGCWVGLSARGGTEGVGLATARAVVVGAISLLLGGLFLTKLLIAVYA